MLTQNDELEFARAFEVSNAPGTRTVFVDDLPDTAEIHVGDTLRFLAKLSSDTWLPWVTQGPDDEADEFYLDITQELGRRGIDTKPIRIQGVRSDATNDNLVLVEVLVTRIDAPDGFLLAGSLATWTSRINPTIGALALAAIVVFPATAVIAHDVHDIAKDAPDVAKEWADAIKVIGVALVAIALVYAYSRSKA